MLTLGGTLREVSGNAIPMTAEAGMDWEEEEMTGSSDDDSSVVESLVSMSWSSDQGTGQSGGGYFSSSCSKYTFLSLYFMG